MQESLGLGMSIARFVPLYVGTACVSFRHPKHIVPSTHSSLNSVSDGSIGRVTACLSVHVRQYLPFLDVSPNPSS